jgi:hypothetical protein
MMKYKKFWIPAAALASLSTPCFFAFPHLLKHQVEKRIPGVQFQDSKLGLSGITLLGVKVDRGWIQGELDSVTADFHGEHVLVDGGKLSLNLDKRPKDSESGGQKRDIQFRNLTVNVSHGKYNATLKEARSEEDNICFTEARLDNPNIFTSNGCLDRSTKILTVQEAKLSKFEAKGVQVQDLIATKIKANLQSKEVEAESVKSQILVKKQTLSIEANSVRATHNPDTINLATVKLLHPWLHSDWITLEKVQAEHKDQWSVSLSSSYFQAQPETLTVSGAEDCSTWVESMPQELKLGPLSQVSLSGKTSFSVSMRPKPSFSLKSDCKAVCSTLPNLRKPFTYTAYNSKGEPFERESGRGSKDWLSYSGMGDTPLAVTTMEDPGFERHHGFISQAFENSFADNLKHGSFLRGGSTITMQLVKNIWLNRKKTISRKAQEFFLAQAVESCYTKTEIMELYLNVVEFGPNKYGVGSGSQHWFQKAPWELEPVEAFWLASILPRPNRTSPPTEDSLKRIEKLMKTLSSDGRIPEFDYSSDDMNFEPEGEFAGEEL